MIDRKFGIIVYIIYFVSTINMSNAQRLAEQCLTPENIAGRCIKISECAPLRKFLVENPKNDNTINYVRQFHCGFEGLIAKVCCSLENTEPSLENKFKETNDQTDINTNKSPHLQEQCLTPDNLVGECIKITNCQPLRKYLTEKSKNDDTINYVRQFHCGFEGVIAKVCCSLENNIFKPSLGNKFKETNVENDILRNTDSAPSHNLLASRETCGKYTVDRIIGGEMTDLRDYPWMALLEYETPNGYAFLCGGSLINNRYVLTAAHCLKPLGLHDNTIKLVSVRLGEYNLKTETDCLDDSGPGLEYCSDKAIDVKIEEEIAHKLFNARDKTRSHDIALLRLSRSVPYSDFIAPVCLPLNKAVENTKSATVVGWGTTETDSKSDVKLRTELPLVPHNRCSTIYESRTHIKIGDGQICAGGNKGKDSCTGDSGGPLMTIERTETSENLVAIGIVSFGIGCATEGFPGVYTRVTSYISWITNNMRP